MATTLTLLSSMSRRRATVRTPPGATVVPLLPTQAAPPVDRPPVSPPDPRLHSAVCCCLLWEQSATGEQAMRLAGGDYERFLTQVGASLPSAVSQPATASNLPATLQTLPLDPHRPNLAERRR